MTTDWRYTKDNQQHGPVSAATLKQLATSGGIGPDDLVWREGMPSWVPARNVKGLFPTSSPTDDSLPPPLPPRPSKPAPPTSPSSESLPQIQINVGKAIKGIGTTVQGVAESQPVKNATAAVQNAAGQAAAGVGNFIRSDAVQTKVKDARATVQNVAGQAAEGIGIIVRSDAVQARVKGAKSFWSGLTTQHKLIAACVAGCGLLMMFCVVGTIGSWMFGFGGGGSSNSAGGGFSLPSLSGKSECRRFLVKMNTLADERDWQWQGVTFQEWHDVYLKVFLDKGLKPPEENYRHHFLEERLPPKSWATCERVQFNGIRDVTESDVIAAIGKPTKRETIKEENFGAVRQEFWTYQLNDGEVRIHFFAIRRPGIQSYLLTPASWVEVFGRSGKYASEMKD